MSAVILRHGDTGPGVIEVRDRLCQLGLLPTTIPASDTFDAVLESAVRVFQQSRGLTVDGIVGQQTLRRLEESRWTLGDRVLSFTPGHLIHGEDVAQLQQRLLQLGFTLDRVDGIFGRITDSAVREFQRNVGLKSDGIAGPAVFGALSRLSRTVAGGNQQHLRELASWDGVPFGTSLDSATIMIDPSDSQRMSLGTSISEADICWDIANRLEGRLLAVGALVVLTRPVQGSLSDERERAALANEQNMDIVISLKCDASDNSQAHGLATYYFGHEYSRSATGMRLAELIQEEITSKSDLLDCNSHAKTWDLLRLTRMPAVRVELGYLSSPVDSSILNNSQSRDAISAGIFNALVRILAPTIG